MPELFINIDFTPFFAFCNKVSASMRYAMGDPDILAGHENAQAVYLGHMRREFQVASRGGGKWPDLAASTKMQRYYKAGGRFTREKGVTRAMRLEQISSVPFPILYDSGSLYTSLYPGQPGSIFMHSNDSVSAGTEIPYARYHQEGTGRMPQRIVLTPPTRELLNEMTAPIVAGFRAMINRAIGSTVTPGTGTPQARIAA
jgi:hypothetical protein